MSATNWKDREPVVWFWDDVEDRPFLTDEYRQFIIKETITAMVGNELGISGDEGLHANLAVSAAAAAISADIWLRVFEDRDLVAHIAGVHENAEEGEPL